MDYKIILKINGVYNTEYNEDNISLGTGVKETLDKTYDLITLELPLTNESKEYQPYTPVDFYIYSIDEDGSLTGGEDYSMIIESDEVSDVYIGEYTYYTHKLILIEETKLLEGEMMPNMTFTQPVLNITSNDGSEFVNEILTQDVPNMNTLSGWTWNNWNDGALFRHSYSIPSQKPLRVISPGSTLPSITFNIRFAGFPGNTPASGIVGAFNSVDTTIQLYPSSVKLINKNNTSLSYELASPSEYTTKGQKVFGEPSIVVKANEYRGSLKIPQNVPAGEYILEYSYSVEKMTIWRMGFYGLGSGQENITKMNTSKISVTDTIPNYDNPTSADTLKEFYSEIPKVIIDFFTVVDNTSYENTYQPIYLNEVLSRIENQISFTNSTITTSGTVKNANTTTGIQQIPTVSGNTSLNFSIDIYRTTTDVRDINIEFTLKCYNDSTLLTTVQLSDILVNYEKYKTLYRNVNIPSSTNRFILTLNSTVYKMSTVRYDVVVGKSPKYTFSSNIMAQAARIVAPEYTFEKKTLWEICLEIGQLFNGIPYMRDSIIDYLILENKPSVIGDFDKEGEVKSSNMTNYATALYTPELKNIIQDENFGENSNPVTYPSPTGWTTVRAIDYNTSEVKRETSAIVIDNCMSGIYKIKRFLVKYKNTTYNITDNVVEKSIYDSLSGEVSSVIVGSKLNTSEKALYLYYQRGKNIIHNPAQLPDNGSVIGWKQTYLTIQHILCKKYGLDLADSSKNIFDYSFRIEYYPYHSRLNLSRQSNLNDVYNQITSNFNQTSNTVSALQFAKHAEETLNKLGNAEIITSYTADVIKDPISIGDCILLNGRNYYVNQKISTYNNNDKSVVLSLTKDNYKQDTRIAVSREYRQYNIDSSNIVRKTLSKPYSVIISSEELNIKSDSMYRSDSSGGNRYTISKSIVATFNPSAFTLKKISNAFVHVQNSDGSALNYNTYDGGNKKTCKNKILPVIGDVLGNTMTFQWDMYDNFSAGRQVRNPTTSTDSWWDNLEVEVGGITIKDKTYGIKIQDDCRYCDDNGSTPSVFSMLFSQNSYALPSGIASTYPETSISKSGFVHYTESSLFTTFNAEKDSREALSFQTTITAQTFDKDISIKNIFMRNPLLFGSSDKTPKWYGYTASNIPTSSDYYYPESKYCISTIKPTRNVDKTNGVRVVQLSGVNKLPYNFIGVVCVYDTGEILLNIKKSLKPAEVFNLYISVFDDIVSLKDIESSSTASRKILPSAYTAKVEIDDDRLILDTNGLDLSTLNDLSIKLVTKHNTLPRGIQEGYHSRQYIKHQKGESLLITGNNWEYNGKKFNKIYIKNNGELVFYIDGVEYNLLEYIKNKTISRADFGNGHTTLQYAILLSDDDNSTTSNYITAYFTAKQTKPFEVTV